MEITELINNLNEFCEKNEIYYLDERLSNLLRPYKPQYIDTVDGEEHRWFYLEKDVYSFNLNGEIFYIGVWGISRIISEHMSLEDCDIPLSFVEMEKYPTFSYRDKTY